LQRRPVKVERESVTVTDSPAVEMRLSAPAVAVN
jgi:hypothetical protein